MTNTGPVNRLVSRRRSLGIVAVALAGAYALPKRLSAPVPETYTWRGVALGAEASLTLQHPNSIAARNAIEACLAEIARLEAVFSLHRPDSALARLNAEGQIEDAPLDLRRLLAEALSLSKRSDGAFDPTVQPVWQLYGAHFATPGADPRGPARQQIEKARSLVGWQRVAIDGGSIRFAEPGMALTLNGIAQGFITDKVGELLRARGFENVLVNLGEQFATGPKWTGESWKVGISDPAKPDRILDTIELRTGAVATSAGSGLYFDAAHRYHHILDAKTGNPAEQIAAITVLADRATTADGLSTALCAGGPELWDNLRQPDARIVSISPSRNEG